MFDVFFRIKLQQGLRSHMQVVSDSEALKATPSSLQPKLPSFILVKSAIEVAAGRELFSFLWHPFLLLMAVLSVPLPHSSDQGDRGIGDRGIGGHRQCPRRRAGVSLSGFRYADSFLTPRI